MKPFAKLTARQKAAVCAEARKAFTASGAEATTREQSAVGDPFGLPAADGVRFVEWRQVQQLEAVGHASLRTCTQRDYKPLLDHFRGLYIPSTQLYVSGEAREFSTDRRNQGRKIQAILCDNELTWEYADAIAEQMFKTARIEWCRSKELTAVITALIKRFQ